MNTRKVLISLIDSVPRKNNKLTAEQIADYLIDHNVIVLPCKLGQTVWVVSKNCAEPYPAKFKYDDISQFGRRVFISKESALKYMRREKRR